MTTAYNLQGLKGLHRGPEWPKMGRKLWKLPMDGFLSSWCLKWGFWDQEIQWTKFQPSPL